MQKKQSSHSPPDPSHCGSSRQRQGCDPAWHPYLFAPPLCARTCAVHTHNGNDFLPLRFPHGFSPLSADFVSHCRPPPTARRKSLFGPSSGETPRTANDAIAASPMIARKTCKYLNILMLPTSARTPLRCPPDVTGPPSPPSRPPPDRPAPQCRDARSPPSASLRKSAPSSPPR